jgi:hypothetical protein
MTERKQTPDVLADILGATQGGDDRAGAWVSEPTSAPDRPSSPARKAPRSERTLRWEHRIVSFQEYHGWRPRYENGVEIAGWMHGPLLDDFVAQAGADGWELTAATAGERLYGISDRRQLYFKRPAQ